MATNVSYSRTTKGKGFSAVGDAAQQALQPSQPAIGPPSPMGATPAPMGASPTSGPTPAPSTLPTAQGDQGLHPVYDSQPGEDPDTGPAHVMRDLGLAIQQMMQKDPQTNQSMADLMDQFMGKGIDYDAESKRLTDLIKARQTPAKPNWVAAGVGSWAGGPEVASKFQRLQQAATGAEAQKQQDIEDTQSNLLKEHIEDLRARGKTREALMMGLMQGALMPTKIGMQQTGALERKEMDIESRRELQDRALGAAEERVRLQINSRKDVADKDRTAGQVMHLYESLLRQQERDVTGASKPIYSADQAMNMALNTILPQVKPGTEIVKTGKTAAGTPAPQPPKAAQSKFAQWKASQAAGNKKAAGQ